MDLDSQIPAAYIYSSVEYHKHQYTIESNDHAFVITAKIFHFSNENIHRPSKQSLYMVYPRYHNIFDALIPEIYTNGKQDADKGYVSILFERSLIALTAKLSFFISGTIAVVDVFENRRFLQSFQISHHEIREAFPNTEKFPFYKYISRSTLLSNPSEFLPEDCLSLEIEINFKYDFLDSRFCETVSEWELSDYFELDKISGKIKLLLETDFGRMLSEESGILSSSEFQTLSGNYMHISLDELSVFQNVYRLMFGSFISLDCDEIHSMCKIADKYDMLTVLDTCKHLIENIYFSEHPEVENFTKEQIMVDFCEKFNGDHLREILVSSADNEGNGKRGNNSETEWICRIFSCNSKKRYHFYKEDKTPTEELEFQFYQ